MSVSMGKKVSHFELACTQDLASAAPSRFTLSKRPAKTLILYFYPKDNTPGCSNQASDFRDLYPAFVKASCEIFGVSRDSLKSHESFRQKFSLPFQLLSDPDETVCELFGVMKLKNMYGKQVRGIERSTFILDASGKLLHEWRGVKVPGHVAEVLKFIESSA
jgi:thioredoxin-dependent peroxiredoxin